jgi:hypothetical protein
LPACCNRRAYEELFDAKEAWKDARDYRRRGLDGTARRLVDFLRGRGVAGRTVLEVGGGVGAIQLELLRAGATRAVNVELSPAYEEAARDLADEAGLSDRLERRVMDFAQEADSVDSADIVLMHRVVCCYPDADTLVSASARRANEFLGLVFPRAGWWIRLGAWVGNRWFRFRKCDFRVYAHPPDVVLGIAEARGFRPVLNERGLIWQVVILERSDEQDQSD